MAELQMLEGAPVLPDDPISRVKATLELTKDVQINVPASQLAFVIHAVYVGLSHPDFDYASNTPAVEQLIDRWADDLCTKSPGLRQLFESDLEMVQFARKVRKSAMMPALPGGIKQLKALAKKLKIKNYFVMDEAELISEIEQFSPDVISEALHDG